MTQLPPNPFLELAAERFVLDESALLEAMEEPTPQQFSSEDISSILEAIHKIAA